jgi:hypothetical protein
LKAKPDHLVPNCGVHFFFCKGQALVNILIKDITHFLGVDVELFKLVNQVSLKEYSLHLRRHTEGLSQSRPRHQALRTVLSTRLLESARIVGR